MRKLVVAIAASGLVVLHADVASAVPDGGLVHEVSLSLPGIDGCTFKFKAFSNATPMRHGDGTVDVVEYGSFQVTGEGEYCQAPVLPTEVHIFDRSPALPTYYTSGIFGASQVVEYAGIPDIMSARAPVRTPLCPCHGRTAL
jgi:hypothetical protein